MEDPLGAFAIERVTGPIAVLTPIPDPPRQSWRRRSAVALTLAIGVAVAAPAGVTFARIQRQLARAMAVAEISQRQLGESELRVRSLTVRNAARAAADVVPSSTALVFPLVRTRGTRSDVFRNRVTLSGDPAWVILVANLATPPVSNLYRSAIDTADGQRIWSNDNLSASQADTFAVGVPSRLLPAGDYVLSVDEQAVTSDSWTPVGRYTFLVVLN